MMETAAGHRMIGGLQVVLTTADELIATLGVRRRAGLPTELLFANTNFVMSCHRMAAELHGPETLIVNDGIGVDLASWMLYHRKFAENLNGTDFVPRLLQSFDRPTRIFLLGARPAAVAATARAWSALPFVEVVGAVDGYAGLADEAGLSARLRDAAPDVLFVALGDPRQAEWIVRQRSRHGVPLVVGVGALFDFVSGTATRAPHWVRRLRMEWLHRLSLEPRRLAKRYSIDLVAFFAHCLRSHRAQPIPSRTPRRALDR